MSVRVVFGGAWAVGGALALASLVNDGIVALLALLILRAALACHTGMATFTEAGVTDKPDGDAEPKAAG